MRIGIIINTLTGVDIAEKKYSGNILEVFEGVLCHNLE